MIGAGALLAALAAAPPQAGFARSVVATAQERLERRFVDEDGDGLLDLMLAVRDADGSRWLLVHRQREGRVFPAEPDARIAVPRAVVAWAVGRFAAGEGPEVLFLARDLAVVRGRADGGLRPLARAPMLLDMPSESQLPYWDHLADLDGDGLDEVALVLEDGFLVVDGEGVERARIAWKPVSDRVPAASQAYFGGRVRASLSSQELSDVFVPNEDAGVISPPPILFAATSLPSPVWADADGDGRSDLSWSVDGTIHVALQRQDGGFGAEPDLRLQLPADLGGDDVRLEWTDFGGGAAADLLLVRSKGGGAVSLTSDWTVRIWTDPAAAGAASADPVALDAPSALVKLAASYAGAYVVDLDGDGVPDLATSAWTVDVGLLGDAATKIRQTVSGWLQRDGALPSRPAFAHTREFTLADVESLRDVPAFARDLTGDGRADFLASTQGGGIEVRPLAGSGDAWAPSAQAALRVPVDAAASTTDVLELNGDGIGDLVVARAGQIEIYLSQRR